jgi:predicted transglutaminase-like cysteine proteinase
MAMVPRNVRGLLVGQSGGVRRLLRALGAALIGVAMATPGLPVALAQSGSGLLAPGWTLFGQASYDAGAVHEHLDVARMRTLFARPVNENSAAHHQFAVITTALRYQPQLQQLKLANRFFNGRPYGLDQVLYGRIDHWATVGEFLSRGGDCEDFAIAKYRALVAAGFPEAQLRIVILEDRQKQEPHAVLVARVGARSYVLDNQSAELLPDSALAHYVPIYSFNRDRVWYHGPRDARPLASIAVTTRAR